MKTQATITAIAAMSVASIAHADIADPGIYSPFDNAEVRVTWLGSNAGYTGNLNWMNPNIANVSSTLWNNKTAVVDQSATLNVVMSQGQRIDFVYDVVIGGIDTFSTANESDWEQFQVTAIDANNFIVAVEDIRLPGGDADFNDAVFEVSFARTIPAPGSLALLGFGGALVTRRRRD